MKPLKDRPPRRLAALAALVVATSVAAVATPPATTARAQGPKKASTPPTPLGASVSINGLGAGSHPITLVTGDRLMLNGSGGGQFTVSVDRTAPRPTGDAQPAVDVTSDGDSVYAIPDDARYAVDTGRVDRRLFDLKYLAENGYADEQAQQLPVIVQYPASRSAASVHSAAEALPASTPTRELTSIDGAALSVPKTDAGSFWATIRDAPSAPGKAAATSLGAGIAKLWLDARVNATLDVSVPLIGAPQAWAAGHDGTGVKVAVLDTGIDTNHPDVAGKVAASQSFVPGQAVADGNGHGTHVAATVAGSGAASGGGRKGVAPGAQLVIGKVLNNAGSGQSSWIIDGMEWATASGAKVVSMSLGGAPTDGTDPLSQAVNDLTATTGALFVIAAGNSGPGAETVGAPGAADAALTVAATDKTDKLASFSSRGPRLDGALKPDIAAPGVGIVAARAAGTSLGTPVDTNYTSLSGTSMATPHVSGAAAILAQRHPDWTAGRLKAALMSTSKDAGFTVYEQGAGRVDVAKAVSQQAVATTTNVDFGNLDPGQNPDPVSKQITYANTGDTPVTLTLARSLRQVGGDPAPGDAFTGDDTVTVPAGGTATATVTLDVGQLAVGRYTGTVVATDPAGASLTTPVGLDRQPPKRKLTVRILGPDGQPLQCFNCSILNVSAYDVPDVSVLLLDQVAPGVYQGFVSAGTYSAEGRLIGNEPDTSRNLLAFVIDPQIEVSGDTEVTLDGRTAKEETIRTPRPTRTYSEVVVRARSIWDGRISASVLETVPQQRILVSPTERVTKGVYRFTHSRMLANPEVTMRVTGKDGFDLQLIHRGYSDHGQRMIGGEDWVPWPAINRRVELVDVGYARPEDLAGKDLTGKLAVMQWGDDRYGPNGSPPDGSNPESFIWTDRVHALKEAGAIGYIAVSSPPAGLGLEGSRSFGIPTFFIRPRLEGGGPEHIELPEVQVPRDQGKELIRRLQKGSVSVDLTADPNIRYTENIYPVHEQQIPESLEHVFDDRQLVAVDTTNHGAQPSPLRAGVSVWTPGQTFNGVVSVLSAAPVSRTEYFGPVNPRVTVQKSRSIDTAGNSWISITAYPKAERSTERWFAPFTTPGSMDLGAAYAAEDPSRPVARYLCTICREGDLLWPNLRESNGNGTVSQNVAINGARLFRADGQEITPTPIPDTLGLPAFKLPPEPANYRMTVEQPGKTTTLTFRSSAPTADSSMPGGPCPQRAFGVGTDKCEQQPAIVLGYDLGRALRLDNTVPAGSEHKFTVFAQHPRSSGDLPDIAGVKVWTSTDDGTTWQAASVKANADGTFTVKATYPPLSATTGAVSIKAEAWDADGNRVEQVLDRAFPLAPETLPEDSRHDPGATTP